MSSNEQKVIVAEGIVDIVGPTWLIVAHKAIDVLVRLQFRLPVGSSEMMPMIFERRILVLATIKSVASPNLNFLLASDNLETIWFDRESV